jgi:ligand-binding SRPBCC domain-containing protein
MPTYTATTELTAPPGRVFALLCRPALLPRLAPPGLPVHVESAPEELTLGTTVTVRARRWGVPVRLTTEVTALERDRRLVEEQRQGPFRRWVVTRALEATAGGTRLTDEVDFEPPGGLLGLLVTAARVEADLKELFAHRAKALAELLGTAESS